MEKTHQRRMDRVCDYIYANLDQDLSVELLSRVANFSKYHFHRQFAAYTGVNVSRYVQLLRLKRASYQLVFHSCMPIIEIAMDARFENPESFSRAFKNTFGQTPSQFRTDPDWQSWSQKYQLPEPRRNEPMDVELVEFEGIKVAMLEHVGPYELLNASLSEFVDWRKTSGLAPIGSSRSFGLPNGDPKTMAPEDFRFELCASVQREVPENPQGVTTKTISGGQCAMIRHLGPQGEAMDLKIYHLYCDWLPESGYELRDSPLMFEFVNLFPLVAEHELITDIFLPIK